MINLCMKVILKTIFVAGGMAVWNTTRIEQLVNSYRIEHITGQVIRVDGGQLVPLKPQNVQ